jgi:ATP-dependent DNA helicase RecG
MASSLQTLIKILRLEQQKEYQNRAVIGGFARFAYHWAREAHSQAQTNEHHALVDEIVARLRDYEFSAPPDRPAIIEHVIGLATGQVMATAEPVAPESDLAVDEESDEALAAEPRRDDVGIGEPDLEDDDAHLETEPEFEAFGTFEHEPPVDTRTVRERRGYAWRQPQAPLSEQALQALAAPVTTVTNVGETRAEQLNRLGVYAVRDLLFLMPRRYDDYSRMKPINRLRPGEDVTVIGVISRIASHPMKSGGVRVEAYIDDGSASLRLNWFNQPWMANQLEPNEPYVASGKIDQYLGRLVMNSPELEPIDQESLHAGRIVPVYPLTKGLGPRTLRRIIKDTVDQWTPYLPDYLPLEVRERADLMDYGDALSQSHFPDTQEDLEAARLRLSFDELFVLHLAMLRQRHTWQSHPGTPLQVGDDWTAAFEGSLPFAFTQAQRRAVDDIQRDLAGSIPMNRLLQGDVGSGKTAVAALAMGIAVACGFQAAIMAPTSILAEQHFANLSRMLQAGPLGPDTSIALLTSRLSPLERDSIYARLADGSLQVVVGTHALIQPGVAFRHLAVAVIDEQHRFGVAQRAALRDKAGGGNPHILVMTATPIPRTLALTLHADLDLTVIDEMPPGRTPVQTRVLQPRERERAYSFIRGQVEKGRQAYIICPLVEDSDRLDARSAVGEYERLQTTVFPDLRLGLVHGQMTTDEKEAAMAAFYRGETHILVSTTVIEVGIDVPNASVILVENASRFGLAQLHQLRGRVGRGADQSYCLLVSDRAFADHDERLRAVEETTDGFKLAEIDWQMRGAGDLLGDRQSGFGSLRFSDLMDAHLVDLVQREARTVFARDPQLSAPEHAELARLVDHFDAGRGSGDIS